MKILIFIRSLDVGGTERQVVTLAKGLSARGHAVTVAELYAGGTMEASLKGTDVRLVPIGKEGRWDVLGPLRRLRHLFRTEGQDVIYSFLPMQNVLAALLRPSSLQSRLVFGVRASGVQLQHYDRLSAVSYRMEAMLSRRADAIVANAECFRADAATHGFELGRLIVIPNGIDTDLMCVDAFARRRVRQAWGVEEQTFVVGMVARLDPMKDHPNFLRAAADFAERHSQSQFICVGGGATGQYRDSLEQMARDLGLAGRVSFVGEQKDVVGMYNAFDIATLSSAFGEGFPNVIGEAMACGVPVAATDVGDARRIINDFGEIVPPRRPDLLSAAWEVLRQRLADDPGLRQSARVRIVDHYNVGAMVELSERALTRVVAENLSVMG